MFSASKAKVIQCQNMKQLNEYHKMFTAMWWMPMEPNGKMVRQILAPIFYDNTPAFGIQFEKKNIAWIGF